MTVHDIWKLLRSHWMTVAFAALLGLAGSIAVTALTTPLYQASTRLYVSSQAGSSANELYQSNRLSQERVLSYTELIKGETLAQRTIDKLDLDITAEQLQSRVTAKSKVDTVLINVTVLDESPVRARDIANALSEEFTVMVRELETPRAGATPDARVVVEQRASVPEKPVVPKAVRNAVFGLVFGLLTGMGIAATRNLLDNTVKDGNTLEEISGVGIVGSIPTDANRKTEPCISFESEQSAIAEAFRKLRTNLQFIAVDNPPKVIVVVSAAPSEGKSTTAINLALALAESGRTVVLVDGDLRRPSINNYLDLIRDVGFSTVLSGAAKLSEVLQETKYPGLTALTSGPTPPNPSELLGSLAAKNTLQELRARFDYVIVDSAPLLAVTDGAVLAAGADGALIVTRFGRTKRDQLKHAVEALTNVGARRLGSILTMTPTRGSSAYGYGYGYYGNAVDHSETGPEDIAAKLQQPRE
jgi:capsular exopolysaccharide synthesis family protein